MRRICGMAFGMALAALSPIAAAEAQEAAAMPNRPITMIVSLAPGGGVDALARILADQLQLRLKQTVVVENRVGGGGLIGIDSLAKSAPDGATIGMLESSSILHKWLRKSVPFDVTTDFAPIAFIARSALVLFKHPSFEATTIAGLVALAKANPGGLQVGTPGMGTTHHLAAALLNSAAGIDITPLPYRGTGPALNDLVGGHVKMIWATPVAVMPFIESGKVGAIATASAKRIADLPAVPTVAESGFPGFEIESWFGVAAPRHTPPAIVARYEAELRAIVAEPEIQSRVTAQSFWPDFKDGAAFGAMVASEQARLGRAILAAGIHPQ